MYVKKFEGDSLDETLKVIKAELGPDAIILKTKTNKGLKGAFNKSKYEITAAISERTYTKKAKVDHALGNENTEKFYQAPANHISEMIDQYNDSPANASKVGYGQVALNRPVKSKTNESIAGNFDSFLQEDSNTQNRAERNDDVEVIATAQRPIKRQVDEENNRNVAVLEQKLANQDEKIALLERVVKECTTSIDALRKREPVGIYSLRTTLRALDISEVYVQKLIRKSCFELSEQDLEDDDVTFEFALRDIMENINTDMPLFSKTDNTHNTVSVLLSETSSGQTSLSLKMAAMSEGAAILKLKKETNNHDLAEHISESEIRYFNTLPEIVAESRKLIQEEKDVFIDLDIDDREFNDIKNFTDGLRRAFKNVEVLVTLSAIHSELYNRKIVNKYRTISDGINITHLDQCLSFGTIFNVHEMATDLPLIFYTTGRVIPNDIEPASAERLLGGMFKFE